MGALESFGLGLVYSLGWIFAVRWLEPTRYDDWNDVIVAGLKAFTWPLWVPFVLLYWLVRLVTYEPGHGSG